MFHVLLACIALTLVPRPEVTTRPTLAQASDTLSARWVLAAQGSEARYRVREQLAGFDFPNDAVGVTNDLTGVLVMGRKGSISPDGSEFRVQLASLATDNERRDNYVRRRTLEVERYPEAVLLPRRFIDLPSPLPDSGSASFQMEADLTLHGQTKPTVWDMTADFGPDSIVGLATTAFPFDTFGITIPQVARVLSVDDNIRLELQFRMVREG
jgi:polyisoprenoid-binding protein YceI